MLLKSKKATKLVKNSMYAKTLLNEVIGEKVLISMFIMVTVKWESPSMRQLL